MFTTADFLAWLSPKMTPTQVIRKARMVVTPYVQSGKSVSLLVPEVGTLYAGPNGWVVEPLKEKE